MSFSIYKPNSKNLGFACSFNVPIDFTCVYATLIRQHSWNTETKNGSFKENKENPENRVNIKLSFVECGAVLDCLERNRNFSSYHDSEQKPKSIKFEVWKDKVSGEAKGYSFGITITDKQAADYKNAFYIGLTFAEGRVLREFLTYAMRKHFKAAQTTQRSTYKMTGAATKDISPAPSPAPIAPEDPLVTL